MSNVDKRVVQMEFDNKQFEKDMAVTVKSLKNFQKQLEKSNSSEGLKDLTKSIGTLQKEVDKVDFSKITNAISNIGNGCSLAASIAFSTVQRLTNDAITKIESGINKIYDIIMTKGKNRALNLEQANFQLMGLLKDGDKVAQVMDDVNYAVNGTAYGLDEAAKVASQLAASNVEAGDQMKAALRGISGVAAMTSSSYEEIGNVFARVAGQGRVMATDLNSIAARGLNATSVLAKFLDTTESNIKELVRNGEIDFRTFATAMDEAFGEQSTKANETFTGAMSNVMAALGRVGAGFQQPYIKYMRPVFVQLIQNVNALKDSFGPLYDTTSFVFEKLSNLAVNFLKKFVNTRIENGKQISTINVLRNSVEMFFKFMVANWPKIENAISRTSNGIISSWPNIKGIFSNINSIIKDLFRLIIGVAGPITSAIKDIFPSKDITKLVRDITGTIAWLVKFAVDVITEITDKSGILYNILTPLFEIIRIGVKIITGTVNAAGRLLKFLLPLISSIIKLTSHTAGLVLSFINFTTGAEKIHDSIDGIFRSIGKVLGVFASLAVLVRDKVTSAFNNLVEPIDNLRLKFDDSKNWLADRFKGAADLASEGIDSLSDKLKENAGLMNDHGNAAEDAGKKVDSFGNRIKSLFSGIVDIIRKNKIIQIVWKTLSRFFKFIWGKITDFGGSISEALKSIFKNIRQNGLLTTIFKDITSFVAGIFKIVGEIIKSIKPLKDAILDLFGAGSVLELIRDIVYSIASFKLASGFERLSTAINNLINGLKKPLDDLGGKPQLKLKGIAEAILEIAIAMVLISTIPSEKIWDVVKTITIIIVELAAAISIMQKSMPKDGNDMPKKFMAMSKIFKAMSTAMIKIAISALIIGNAIKSMENEWQVIGLIATITSIGALIDIMAVTFSRMSKITASPKQVVAMSIVMHAMGNLFIKIGGVTAVLSKMDKESLWSASSCMAILFGVVTFCVAYAIGAIKGDQIRKALPSNSKALAILGSSTPAPTSSNVQIAAKNILALSMMIMAFGNAFVKIGTILAVIGKLSIDKMTAATGSIIIIGVLISSMIGMTKNIKNVRTKLIESLTDYIRAYSTCIFVIALAVLALSKIRVGDIGNGILILSFVSGFLIAMFGIINKMDKSSHKKITALSDFIKSFSKTILIISSAIILLASLDSAKVLIASGIIAILTTLIGALIIFVNKFTYEGSSKKFKSMSNFMLGFSGAISIMAVALNIINNINIQEAIKALAVIGVLSFIIGKILKMTDELKGDAASKIAGPFVKMAASIGILVLALRLIDGVGPDAIKRMGELIEMLIRSIPKWTVLFFTAFLNAFRQMANDIIDSLIAFIVGIFESLATNAQRIVQPLIKLLTIISTELMKFSNTVDMRSLLGAVGIVAIIASIIFILQVLASDMKSALKGILLLGMVLGAIVGTLAILHNLKNPEATIDMLSGLATVILSMGAIALAVITLSSVLNKFNLGSGLNKTVFNVMLSIAIVLASFVVIVGIIGTIGQFFIGVLQSGVQVLGLVGQALGAFLGGIVHGIIDPIANSGLDMASIASLSAMILILKPLLNAIPELTLIVAAVGAVAQILKQFDPEFSFLISAKDMLIKVGEVIGGFIGGIIGGVLEVLTATIITSMIMFADGMSNFMEHLQPFLGYLNELDASYLAKAGILIGLLVELTAAELISALNGLIGMFTGITMGISGLASQLCTLGKGMVEFSKILKNGKFDGDIVESAANSAKMLANVANNLPKHGGLWQMFAGTTMSMSDFGSKLKRLGESLLQYANSVSKITKDDAQKIDYSAQALESLVNVANKMPKEGGWMQKIIGTNIRMDDFGKQLEGLGKSLVKFAYSVNGISKEAAQSTDNIIPVFSSIVEIYNKMPKKDGFWQQIVGQQEDLDIFGNRLPALANGLKSFADATNGLTEEKSERTKALVDIFGSIVEINNKMPETGGWKGFFVGNKESIDQFGEKLPALGRGLQNYVESLKGLSNNAIEKSESATKVFGQIVDISDMLPTNQSDWDKFFNGTKENIKEFAEKLPALGEGMYDFAVAIKDMPSPQNVEKVGNAIANLSEVLGKVKTFDDLEGLGGFLASLDYIASGTDDYKPSDWNEFANLFGSSPDAKIEKMKKVSDILSIVSDVFEGMTQKGEVNYFLNRIGQIVHGNNSYYQEGDIGKFANLLGSDNGAAEKTYKRLARVKDTIEMFNRAFESTTTSGEFAGNFLRTIGAIVHGNVTGGTGSYREGDLYAASLLLNPKNNTDNKTTEASKKRLVALANTIKAFNSAMNGAIDVNFDVSGFLVLIGNLVNGSKALFGEGAYKEGDLYAASLVLNPKNNTDNRVAENSKNRLIAVAKAIKGFSNSINGMPTTTKKIENFLNLVHGLVSGGFENSKYQAGDLLALSAILVPDGSYDNEKSQATSRRLQGVINAMSGLSTAINGVPKNDGFDNLYSLLNAVSVLSGEGVTGACAFYSPNQWAIIGTMLGEDESEAKDFKERIAQFSEVFKNLATSLQIGTGVSSDDLYGYLEAIHTLVYGSSKTNGYEIWDWYALSGALNPKGNFNNNIAELTYKRLNRVSAAISEFKSAFTGINGTEFDNQSIFNYLHLIHCLGSGRGSYLPEDWLNVSYLLTSKNGDNNDAQSTSRRLQGIINGISGFNEIFKAIVDYEIDNQKVYNFLHLIHCLGVEKNEYKASDWLSVSKLLDADGNNNNAQSTSRRLQGVIDAIIGFGNAFSGLNINKTKVSDFMDSMHSLVFGGSSGLGMLIGTSQNEGIFMAVSYLLGKDDASIKKTQDRLNKVISAILAFSKSFKNDAETINKTKIDDFVSAVNSIATLSISAIKEDFAANSEEAIKSARKMVEDLISVFSDDKETKSNIQSSISKMVEYSTNAINYFTGEGKGFYVSGQNAVQGFCNGINSKLDDAWHAGYAMSREAIKGTKKGLAEKSPSKIYENDIAFNAVRGFVNGFKKRSSMAFDAGKNLGQSAIDGTKGISAKISNIINSDVAMHPIISPVLDLSNISNGSTQINGILNAGKTIDLAGSASNIIEQNRIMRIRAEFDQNGSPDVVSAVNSLNARMKEMENAILNRPIYLDKEKVSKELTPSIDRNLGRKAYYSRRGN